MKLVTTRARNRKENSHRSLKARSRDEAGRVKGGSSGEEGRSEKRGGYRDVHRPTFTSWAYVMSAAADVEYLPGCYSVLSALFLRPCTLSYHHIHDV